ncbi:hypothetical protein JCM15519_07350 [Fundidesulfovibrio butyratiphilus]
MEALYFVQQRMRRDLGWFTVDEFQTFEKATLFAKEFGPDAEGEVQVVVAFCVPPAQWGAPSTAALYGLTPGIDFPASLSGV